ncbi:MAG: transglutaminase-like domain-containing protein [Oscillospiraceae bacterium]|jgi:transglutaminase-like putative cysteine protease|nr:transglutaminase-like domain-containing protein [Oscillospiraceae bacterium]
MIKEIIGKLKHFAKIPQGRHVITYISNLILLLTAVFCTYGTLISAFNFVVEMTTLFQIWFVAAAIASIVAMIFRSKGVIAMAVVVIVVFVIFNYTAFTEGLGRVIFTITTVYNRYLPIPLRRPQNMLADPAQFFSIGGIISTVMLSYAICVRRSTLLTILFTFPILILTVVITDTTADVFYIFGIIAVYLTVLISGAFNPDDFRKRSLVFIPVLLLTALFMSFTFFLTSPERYDREKTLQLIDGRLRTIIWQMSQFGQRVSGDIDIDIGIGWPDLAGSGGLWTFNTRNVRISRAGNREIHDIDLLEVISSESGIFYLYGFNMGYFNGQSWERDNTMGSGHPIDLVGRFMPAVIAEYYFEENPESIATQVSMHVRKTGDNSPVTYEPYYTYTTNQSDNVYTEASYHVRGSFLSMRNDVPPFILGNYNYVLSRMMGLIYDQDGQIYIPDDLIGQPILINPNVPLNESNEHWINYNNQIYTEIDPVSAADLRAIAIEAGIDITADREEIVDAVGRYIRTSGFYTLTPEAVPDDEDFVLYFLQEMSGGYCIHFATAATQMLRALGIPARFTTGFVVTIPRGSENTPVTVTDRSAHSWVEVFYEDVGWLYLEVTPSTLTSGIPPARPHTPPEEEDTPDSTPDNESDPNDINPNTPTPDEVTPQSPNDNTGGTNNDSQGIPEWLQNMLWFFGSILFIVVVLYTRARMLHKSRQRQFNRDNTNAAVIYMWGYIKKIGGKTIIIPSDIEEIALKARFSLHRISEKERQEVRSYADRLRFETLGSKDEFMYIWLRFIRGL